MNVVSQAEQIWPGPFFENDIVSPLQLNWHASYFRHITMLTIVSYFIAIIHNVSVDQ